MAQVNLGEVFRGAAARVRLAWGQWFYHQPLGDGVCALGAIRVMLGAIYDDAQMCLLGGDGSEFDQAERFLERALKLAQPERGEFRPVPRWNDTPGQTAENVAVGLEYAALLWDQEQQVKVADQGTAAVRA